MKQFYVYMHFRSGGNPFYVGKGTGKRSHDFSRRNTHHERIVAKDGKQNIEVLVFPRATEQLALADEILWIKILHESGYELCNQTSGGDGLVNPSEEVRAKISAKLKGKKLSLETRAKMSASQIGNKNTLGKKLPSFTAEHRAKIGQSHKRKVVSEETRAKLSAASIANGSGGIRGKGSSGHKHTPEMRIKISSVKKAWWAEKKLAASGSA
jgi:hypothetical protein